MLRNCLSCGQKFSGYGFKCASCLQTEELKKEHEKNREQERQLAATRDMHAREATRAAERIAQGHINVQLAILAVTAKIEDERRQREEKLIQATLELKISDADAYRQGYELDFLSAHPNAFLETLDASGVLTQFTYSDKFLSDSLCREYDTGAWQRLCDEGVDSGPGLEFMKNAAYRCGFAQLGLTTGVFIEWKVRGNKTGREYYFTTSPCQAKDAEIYQDSESAILKFRYSKLPFDNQDVDNSFLSGVTDYLHSKNTPEAISSRKQEAEAQRRESEIAADEARRQDRMNNMIAFSMFGLLLLSGWALWHYFIAEWVVAYPKIFSFAALLLLMWNGILFFLGLCGLIWYWFL